MARESEKPPIETVLHDEQNWAARSHRELYAAVHNNNDPGQAGEIGSEWTQFGSEMTEAAQVVADRVTKSESGWTGEAAESARAALKLLSDWVTETAQTTVEVGNRVAEQGRIMATARANMPEPQEFSYDAATQTLAAPGLAPFVASAQDVQAASEQSRAAHDQAVVVMNAMEQSSRDIDRTTPVFSPPFNPVTGEVEEPVVPTARMSGGATLAGTGVESLRSAPADGSAAQPYSGGAGTGAAPAAAAAPNAPGYAPPSGGNAHTSGNPAGQPYQQPAYSDTTAAASTTYASPTMSTPHSTDYRPTMPTGGNTGWDPYSGYPSGSGKGNTTPTSSTPKGTGGGGGGAAAAAAAAKAGFGGGAGAFGAPGGPGAAGGQMQPGGTTGALQGGQQAAQMRGGAMPAGPGGAGAAGMAGGPMGGPMGAGRGEEDKEHRSASYIMSGDLFEVPGENLPPAVIGGAKKKKAPEQ